MSSGALGTDSTDTAQDCHVLSHRVTLPTAFPFPFLVLLKHSGERIVVNLQLLLVIVVEMCVYVGWGRFALGSLESLAGTKRGKKYSYEFVGFK